jgi:hypothetical protein
MESKMSGNGRGARLVTVTKRMEGEQSARVGVVPRPLGCGRRNNSATTQRKEQRKKQKKTKTGKEN